MSKRIDCGRIVYGYWRSSAFGRVHIALNLKGLDFEFRPVSLLDDEQRSRKYLAINPQGLVPTLMDKQTTMSQSLPIMEYLDDMYPFPQIMPNDVFARARVRTLANIIACDIHPLQNLRVKNALLHHDRMYQFAESGLKRVGDERWGTWCKEWICSGFDALETLLSESTGTFCFGDSPTIADCCLIPQVHNAKRFKCDLEPYWRIRGVYENCMQLEAFQKAAPENQPDAPKA